MDAAIDFRTFYFEKNQGHGNARRKGLFECKNNLIALMDSDDISLPFRFEKQLEQFLKQPQLDIVGGQITEFIGEPEHITGIREVPLQDDHIKKYMQKRCPMNQVTVMFKKDSVEKAGGYIDWYCEEDYYLWSRMMLHHCKFANIPESVVFVRVGDEMSARRGGVKYFKSELRMQRFLKENGIINLPQFMYNVVLRFGGEVILPDFVRAKLFRLFRKGIALNEQFVKLELVGETENYKTFFLKDNKINPFPPFSVSICVYGGDNAEWFDTALESVIYQTVKPQEIVLVVDGPVPESIQDVITKYQSICSNPGREV